MLRTRALVAAVAIPLLVAVSLIGGWVFALTVAAALLLAGDEYARLLRQGAFRPPEWLILALILLPLAAVWYERPEWNEPGLALLLIVGLLYAIWSLERFKPQPIVELSLTVFGGVYIGLLGRNLLAVHELEQGAWLTLFVYALVAIADTGAYFVGSRIGKHKMAPRVSPKKSWEGYVGGVVSGVIAGALLGLLDVLGPVTPAHGALLGLLIGVFSPIGDLGISTIKRQVGAKDSSHLIPGHGGVLDRLDSVLVTFTIGYYYLIWFVL